MSFRQQLLDELTQVNNSPNEFEKLIKQNQKLLFVLSDEDLTKLNMLRKRCKRLCSAVPYCREDIKNMVEYGEIGLHGTVGELYDIFNVAEYIFEKAREK